MHEALVRICELQPAYSSQNTPEMQERGDLLRHSVKPALEALKHRIAPCMGRFGDDFHVDASDGIGRKTELPWARFCSEIMSPKPTEGFYFVMHFSTDGSAVHFTIGCGSSRYERGEFVVLPDREIDRQTEWARGVIREKFGTLSPFDDIADFGAKRPLPKSFERATALSKRVGYDELEATDLEFLMELAAERLAAIYHAQSTGRDLSAADIEEAEIEAAIRPARKGRRRQGYGLSAPERRAVEIRAMQIAIRHLEDQGYVVHDRSANKPFDLEAVKDGLEIKIEVKGTTSDLADTILMTSNEVNLHRSEKGATCLIIVSCIRLDRSGDQPTADGGNIEVLMGWDVDEWQLEPTAFRLTRN